MAISPDSSRQETISRIILAPPRALYRAHLDPEMIANWRTPEGARAEILSFSGRLGGSYEIALHGDPSDNRDGPLRETPRLEGSFVELVPDEKIIERAHFDDAASAGSWDMTIVTTMRPVRDGTKVTVQLSGLPANELGDELVRYMINSLRNLAMLAE